MRGEPSVNKIPSANIGNGGGTASVLGLGCWAFGGSDWGIQNDNDSIDAIKVAYKLGITHFDTAQAYGKGHSEEIVGRALKNVRDKVFIASKMMPSIPEKVSALIQLSLKRLKTDYIDLFYIHWPRKNADLEGIMSELEKAREKGLIRGIGVSNFSIEQIKKINAFGKIDANQICYNLLWRWSEKEMIPFCQECGIPVITYSSIAQGILTGKFGMVNEFQPGDHRKGTVFFDNDVWPHIYVGIEKLKKIGNEAGLSLRDLAIQWVIHKSGISSVLIGARNSVQVSQNINSINAGYDNSILDKFTEVSNEIIKYVPDTGNIFRWYP